MPQPVSEEAKLKQERELRELVMQRGQEHLEALQKRRQITAEALTSKRQPLPAHSLKRDRDQANLDVPLAAAEKAMPPTKTQKKADQPVAMTTAGRQVATSSPRPSAAAGGSAGQGSGSGPSGETKSKYANLLTVIEELGKDIRPSYACNKMAIERLKRSLIHARIVVRECMLECERISKS